MDRNLLTAVGLIALVMLFVFPQWTPVQPSVKIKSADLQNGSVRFTVDYSAPWTKSCYLVVYGPFEIDKGGHEEGNNIYVLSQRSGTISDTLVLQRNATLDSLRVELWCDWDRLAGDSYSLVSASS